MLVYIEPHDLDLDNNLLKIPQEFNNKLMNIIVVADWCGHCKNTLPKYIEDAKNSTNENHIFAIVDSTKDFKDDQQKISKFFKNFKGFPHIVCFKNGKEIASYNGDRSKGSFTKFLNQQK